MLTVIVEPDTYDFAQGNNIAELIEFDGFGMSPNHLITERGPLQHGELYRDIRLDMRVIRLVFGISGASWDNLFYKRQQLLNIFRPRVVELPVQVRFTVDAQDEGSNQDYQIDTYFLGDMSLPSRDIEGFYQKVVISLIAPNPTFYYPEQANTIFGITVGGQSFNVPSAVPLGVGASTIDDTRAITNRGNWITYPVITILGPVQNPIIENITTDEQLDFTGLTLGSTEERVIDCNYGQKTVVDEDGVNQIADLTAASDLATFHLEPGDNSIKVSGTNGDASTEVYIRFYERFVGI